MNRREFAKLIVACGMLMPTRHSGKPRATKSFYVAGVRFHTITAELKTGDPVILREGSFKGESSCAILTTKGKQIGYIPQKILNSLNIHNVHESFLSAVNENAVPWKRYRVALII